MILDELVLHDVGVFGGRQALTLTPDGPDRPIVLVGGLNGGGKTTILEALQICLFGSAAPALGRGSYLGHLRKRVHRGAGAKSATLELAFRHNTDGVERSYRIIRSWSVSGETCRETFEVLRDGELDRLAADNWAEQVEEFMPTRIAGLFLFDGERVEAYADPSEAPRLVETAVHNLLGLDVVERLSADLSTLERRKRRGGETGCATTAADDVRAQLAHLRAGRIDLQREMAEAYEAHDRAVRELDELEGRFRREGGELYERRAAIEAEATTAHARFEMSEERLRIVAGGTAPLLLVTDLLDGVRARGRAEAEVVSARSIASALRTEHEALLGLPEISSLPKSALAAVDRALLDRRTSFESKAGGDVALDLDADSADAIEALVADGVDDVREELASALRLSKEAKAGRRDANRALEAVPTEESLAELLMARANAQMEVARLEGEKSATDSALQRLDEEIGQLAEREARLSEQEAAEIFRGQDVERMLEHSARVRATLVRFRQAVVARHVERIEQLVLESFRGLVRKPGLVSDLTIDPATFELSIVGADGGALGPEELSAGERQLLAVALLWGLARASGRPLPTVIDTPLGRLDSEHRSLLVDRYFPRASHQVMLLSTDEEISGGYHQSLSPHVCRSYHLEFDHETGRTKVRDGYLGEGVLRDVA